MDMMDIVAVEVAMNRALEEAMAYDEKLERGTAQDLRLGEDLWDEYHIFRLHLDALKKGETARPFDEFRKRMGLADAHDTGARSRTSELGR